MSTSLPAERDVRKATRDTQQPVLGGVAGGLARHLGIPVLWVRAAFVLLLTLGGLGLFLYGVLWMVLPADEAFDRDAPGLEGASRDGRRPGRIRRLADGGPGLVLAALGIGAVLLLDAVFGQGALFWAALLGVGGVALLWRQADEAQRERWLDRTGRVDPVRVVLGQGGWAAYARLGLGLLLVVGALVLVALRGDSSLELARDVTLLSLLAVAGIGIVVGPWIYRLAADLTAERAERVRSQDRADVAAHLHDSVLQTLALIQKNAHDPAAVARLARSQERDLRAWLYRGDQADDDDTLAAALRRIAAEVEDTHGIAVEVVVVGDLSYAEQLGPLVRAAGEALTNAARHAGVDRVDLYAEVTPGTASVYVRDRGRGFDPEDIPDDRYGVRRSIRDRMARHGGTVEISTAPGAGTEVRLHLPVEGAATEPGQDLPPGGTHEQ